jgi:hypothetical protein
VRRSKLGYALLLVQCVLACDGRQLTIFDVSVASTAGSGTAGGGSGGSDAGSGDEAGTSGTIAVAGTAGGSAEAGGMAGTSSAQGGAGGGGTGGDGLAGSPGAGSGGGGGGMGGGFGPPCSSDADCMGWQCDFPDCEATTGICVPPPTCFRADPRPVCGCDGITYWNDCIRLQSRARPAYRDQCFDTALPCYIGFDCITESSDVVASCSHLLPPGSMCGPGVGSCWVLPTACDPTLDPKRWRECVPPNGGPPGPCRDTCSAIAIERPHLPMRGGDVCGN